jgi:hypothetical protein
MTEADLLSQLSSFGDFLWSLMQYWTSISVGILIASHFVASRLNGFILAIFIIIYTVFTVQIVTLMQLELQAIKGIFMDLEIMAGKGVALSNTARQLLEHSPVANDTLINQLIRLVMTGGMFLITISYPIYCKRRAES